MVMWGVGEDDTKGKHGLHTTVLYPSLLDVSSLLPGPVMIESETKCELPWGTGLHRFVTVPPRKLTCPPKKGPFQREISSSNH